MRLKSLNKIYIISASVFIVLLVSMLYLFFSPHQLKNNKFVTFTVEQGDSYNKVLERLKEQGIVESVTPLKVLGFILGADTKIKAGRYRIESGYSYVDLVSMLVDGEAERSMLVTLYSGISMNAVANKLHALGVTDKQQFLSAAKNRVVLDSIGINAPSMEGYILPDEYHFYKETPAELVLQEFAKNFQEFAKLELQNNPTYSLHELVTLASIIDGETNSPDEMPIISGVYHNRLQKGMLLQSDPTVQYALGGEYRRLLYADLNVESPYNTYRYAGLPPGPINNPGRQALLAANTPGRHAYLFFVADTNGTHDFSVTYNEHLVKAKKYHKWLNSLD